jgi:hypothetical protein
MYFYILDVLDYFYYVSSNNFALYFYLVILVTYNTFSHLQSIPNTCLNDPANEFSGYIHVLEKLFFDFFFHGG